MNSWHRITADSTTLLGRTGIPRKVLQRLVVAARLGIGFSVLDVGCQRGELAAYFDSLGIQCAGLAESPADVMEARKNVPTCEFHCALVGDPLPSLQTEFDLVLVRDTSAYRCSMLSRNAFAATAQLFKHVRPGGCLAFLTRVGIGPSADGHQLSCSARHIASLPGEAEQHEIPGGFLRKNRLRFFASGSEGFGHGIAILRLPPRRLERPDWAIANAARADRGPCCHWAPGQVEAGGRPISRAA